MGITINWNGHFKNGTQAERATKRFQRNLESRLEFNKSRGWETRDPKWEVIMAFESHECPYCNTYLHLELIDGEWKIPEPCPDSAGNVVVEFDLNVPSGKLFVTNDLRRWFPGQPDYEVNQVVERNRTTSEFAKIGLAFGFVGDAGLRMYRTRKGYLIASPPCEDDPEARRKFRHRKVASVCTDLWWYSICDYDELQYRAKVLGLDLSQIRFHDTVDVRPGLYHFTHWNKLPEREDSGPVIFTEITRTGPALPWKPEDSEANDYLKRDIPAGRILLQLIKNHPCMFVTGDLIDNNLKFKGLEFLTGENRKHALARAADYCFGVLHGEDWHPNGFPIVAMDEDTPDTEIPDFDFKAHGYTISPENSAIFNCRLSPSFAKLALNLTQSALAFGVLSSSAGEEDQQKRQEMAFDIYEMLRVKYPEQVDPAFDAEFKDRDCEQKISWEEQGDGNT